METYYSKKDLINAKNDDTNYIYDLTDLEEFLEYVPTADVVPRDEVERYKLLCEDLQEENLDLLNVLHNESEYVAKQIFEEIEINIFKLETPYQTLHCIPSGLIEELKEKYTKGGEQK